MADKPEDRGDAIEEIEDPTAGGDDNAGLEVTLDNDDDEQAEETSEDGGDDSQDGGSGDDTVDGSSRKDKVYIPKERFDEAVGKARREAQDAKKKLAESEAREKARQGQIDAKKIEAEIDDLEDKLDGARADGNKEAAKAIRSQIREKQMALVDARADVKAAYATAQAVEQVRWDNVVERMEKEHPELDPSEDNELYDQEKVDEIMDLTEAYVAKGDSSSEALKKAIRMTYRGAAPAKDEGAKKRAEEAAAKRKQDAVEKARLAAKVTPPAPGKGGKDSDAAGKKTKGLDINKISDEEFDKLPDAEKKRLRGDGG